MPKENNESKDGRLNGLANVSSGYGSIPSSSTRDDQTVDSEDEGSVYTELLRGSVPCPTCRGVGSIPKEQESQLVALIPMKDKRLRPSRTYVWVCLAVFLCLTTAGLLMFFMFPRGVEMMSRKPYLNPIGSVYVNVTQSYVHFTIENTFNLSNQNYVPITVNSVEMTVLYDTQVLSESKNLSIVEVSMRSDHQFYITTNVSLDKDNKMGYMAQNCLNEMRWAHEMVMLFQFTCNYSVLGHTEQTTLQTFQFVSCYSDIIPPTIVPPKTIPKTTKAPPVRMIL
ncbi:hypothetical protein ACF0H5_018930 [Mactra antiquata]